MVALGPLLESASSRTQADFQFGGTINLRHYACSSKPVNTEKVLTRTDQTDWTRGSNTVFL
jgi:hypothetical protein